MPNTNAMLETHNTMTARDIKNLRAEALNAGDSLMAAIASAAINGDDEEYVALKGKRMPQTVALDYCLEAINAAIVARFGEAE